MPRLYHLYYSVVFYHRSLRLPSPIFPKLPFVQPFFRPPASYSRHRPKCGPQTQGSPRMAFLFRRTCKKIVLFPGFWGGKFFRTSRRRCLTLVRAEFSRHAESFPAQKPGNSQFLRRFAGKEMPCEGSPVSADRTSACAGCKRRAGGKRLDKRQL